MADRRIAAVLVLVLPFVATGAPFLHAHPDDHHEGHHRGARVHAHLEQHTVAAPSHGGEPVLRDDDGERTLTLGLFVAVSPDAPATPGLPAPHVAVSLGTEPAPRPAWRVVHGHDPPILDSVSPRPPPPSHLS